MLEESISQIEQRISELQQPTRQRQPDKSGRVLLQTPYATGNPSNLNWTAAAEPPMDMVENLISTFLLSASEFGFFLNSSRFRQCALVRQPIGSPQRPLPALLTTAYLWGLRLSNQPMLQAQEPVFLARALQQTANGLSSPHPDRVLHTLQAELLLTYYFFASGRFLEGKYHASACVSLALSTGLHTIRSTSMSPSNMLAPSRDAVEEGERIHAWWTVVILDNTWAVALEEGPHLDLNANVDTPWPLEIEQYEGGHFDSSKRYSNTVTKFINATPTSDTGNSTHALLAKASLLWQRAYALQRSSAPQPAVDFLDAMLANFTASLPLPTSFSHITATMGRALVVAHSIAHAAIIELHRHRERPESRRKSVTAAQMLLNILTATTTVLPGGSINPVMGTVWRLACRVLMDELSEMSATRYHGQHLELQTLLARVVEAIERFRATSASPFLDYQIGRIQEAWQELLMP
ncbi:Zn(2)-C6 fungal-type domain-containing protein [Mycena indigotica]|uniref:Zn(2)-C6 fungal-type domain-containing protein n=1 Tax=Mycena indigotica TaxID=2126181 RepID=A0A8H6TDS5_9AGAR|nr:Zn(2)-C6 fungal-type domain-containing protein [Mycena indigotica]KAF7315818.1 Zn(2)-C6 fungal-type domain-containing protein [Mycena indigotica]